MHACGACKVYRQVVLVPKLRRVVDPIYPSRMIASMQAADFPFMDGSKFFLADELTYFIGLGVSRRVQVAGATRHGACLSGLIID